MERVPNGGSRVIVLLPRRDKGRDQGCQRVRVVRVKRRKGRTFGSNR